MVSSPIQNDPSRLPSPAVRSRGRFDAAVVFNRLICREHYLLRVRIPEGFPATQPGQFVQLGCRPPDRAIDMDRLLSAQHEWTAGQRVVPEQPELCGRLAMLRRPFSIAGRGDDPQGSWIEVIHRVVGTGTQWLAGLREGDAVDLIGPLGNWFSLRPGKSVGLLVGGGVGLPPMFYLAQALKRAGWKTVGFVGAMAGDLLAVTFVDGVAPGRNGEVASSVQEFARHGFGSVVTTDDGSVGLRGQITDGLGRYLKSQPRDEAAQAVVFTCGPEPMMHAVAGLAAAHGVACQVCLEQAMACGMGTCQSCVVKIEEYKSPHAATPDGRPWRYRLACTDGPVFDAGVVVW